MGSGLMMMRRGGGGAGGDFVKGSNLVLNLNLWHPDLQVPANGPDLLSNSGFETGDPPTGYGLSGAGATLVRSAAKVHGGSYSALSTRNGTDAKFNHNIFNEFPNIKGLSLTHSAYVWASVANRARLNIWDGVSSSNSSWHTGDSTWQLLSLTQLIALNAGEASAYFNIEDGDTSVYFDDAYVYLANVVKDISGSGLYAQCTGLTVLPGIGHSFDGIDDFIAVQNAGALSTLVGPFSVECWFKPTATGGNNKGIITKGDLVNTTPPNSFSLHQGQAVGGPAVALFFVICDDTNNSRIGYAVDNVFTAGSWYHIIGTYSGGTTNAAIKLYVNGVNVASTHDQSDGAFTSMTTAAVPLYLMRSTVAGGSGYNDGTMATAHVYTRVLSAAEVLRNFAATRARYGV